MHSGDSMGTVETITAAIAELPPNEIARIRSWLDERDQEKWDAQIEVDER